MCRPLAPFKGICNCCHQRTVVRLYPYNAHSWLGTYCKPCAKKIDKAITEAGAFVDDGERL